MKKVITVGVVFGTRPEAIKLAPVIFELKKRANEFRPVLISTAQHRQMLDQVLDVFGIRPDIDLDLMQANQSLGALTSRVLQSIEATLPALGLDCLMVQGDTTTVFAAALAAFYHRIPVAHVEAGLRSRDVLNPFPEEVNRRLASVVTDLHFAPTPLARENLLAECVPADRIAVTGNTVIDAVQHLQNTNMLEGALPAGIPADGKKLILVTSHRRESWGAELENICSSIAELVCRFDDVRVAYPVHMNPNVRNTVETRLKNLDRVHLTAPLDYFSFLGLLRRCHFVLTDSGGVQEEAPVFGKPVLVLRKVTERPEASMIGLSRVVGTSREAIVREASRLLTSPMAYRAMSQGENPYGDGRAAERIVEALSRWFAGARPALQEWQEFPGMATRLESIAA